MNQPRRIGPGVFEVAGPELTDSRDASAYLVASPEGPAALIDCGAGESVGQIASHIETAGVEMLTYIIVTHAHIDHIGGLAALAARFNPVVAAHAADAAAIETADETYSAARWYGLTLMPARVDRKLDAPLTRLPLGSLALNCLHTPGHTPGSLAVWADIQGQRHLFGQDIHGPFHPDFKSSIADWRKSMQTLLKLEAEVLAEGHYGVTRGREEVRRFIQGFMDRLA